LSGKGEASSESVGRTRGLKNNKNYDIKSVRKLEKKKIKLKLTRKLLKLKKVKKVNEKKNQKIFKKKLIKLNNIL
jgi:hypothetical protein